MNIKKFLNSKKFFYFYVCFSVLLVFSFTALLVNKLSKQPNTHIITENVTKPVINNDTIIETEITYICKNKLIGQIPAEDLLGEDYQGLLRRFPKEEGWKIDDSETNKIKLVKNEKKLCSLHKSYRHLGINKDFVAVFEGPLGYNDFMLQQEKVKVNRLPKEMQDKLNQVMNFNIQPVNVKKVLKHEMEFSSDISLNGALENLSEYDR